MKPEYLTERHIELQLFSGYSESDKNIFAEFRNSQASPQPGFIVDFLGSRIRTSAVWKDARTLDGSLLGIPDPGDFHSEAIEWIGLLKAVRSAKDRYVAMELGAGFGPWTVAGGTAARLRGIEEIRLYAAEADSNHFRCLQQHLTDNGFQPNEYRLFEAAVGACTGEADWPLIEESSTADDYGLRPTVSGGDYRGRRFQQTKRIPVVAMRELVTREPLWNLVHIDVQGHEVDICRSCIEELNARVSWIIVGTHSRKLDGDFLELMYSAGWSLQHEKPSKFWFTMGAPSLEAMTLLDGTQVWRNPRLVPPQPGDRLNSFAQEITSSTDRVHLKAGQTYSLPVTVKNTGTEPWFGGSMSPVNLGYRWFDPNGKRVPIEGNRARLSRCAIAPGESDSLQLPVTAPDADGSYSLWISMVQEEVAWFYERGAKPFALHVVVQ